MARRTLVLLRDWHGTFDVSTDAHRQVKRLTRRDNLRDNMTTLELALTMLSEATSTTLHQTRDSQGLVELERDAMTLVRGALSIRRISSAVCT